MYKLVSFDVCPYVQRSVITLQEKGVPYEIEYIDLNNKPEWFMQLSPLGKVPILIVEDTVIFESSTINEYLDEIAPGRKLQPSEPLLQRESVKRSTVADIRERYLGYLQGNGLAGNDKGPSWLGRIGISLTASVQYG